MSAWKLAASAN
jgi:hypothetical protein